jgi:serine protease AprX
MRHALSYRVLVVAAAAILLGCAATAGTAAQPGSARSVGAGGVARVVVQQASPGDPRPARSVERLGGRVGRRLPIVDGFAATVPAEALPALRDAPGVLAVRPDGPVAVAGALDEAARLGAAARAALGAGPPQVFRDVVGATRLNQRGTTGAGTTVALIDTGVAATGDLAGRLVQVRDGVGGLLGAVAACKNLSGEAGCGDTYGHGTFIAGLIAGDGRGSGGMYRGVAPGARLLSVKIAGRDGSSDVSTLLAAIQWVVSHREAYGIKVLNLSLGTDSAQSYKDDPLNYAVERAWKSGIVVVTAASNRGPGARTIAKPGDDPYVITVGAVDDQGTVPVTDDVVPDFSARGPTAADGLPKPDVAAPGTRVVSVNARGSLIDRRYPEAAGYRRASGTSMATAVVSGLAALLVASDAGATPDRVKFMLTSTARPVPGADRSAVGAGLVDGWKAATAAPPGLANRGLADVSLAGTSAPRGRGRRQASLDPSRGRMRVRTGAVDPAGPVGSIGAVLTGQRTTTLANWQPGWVLGPWTEETWRRTTWQLRTILPTRWAGTDWSGRNWQWQGPPPGPGRAASHHPASRRFSRRYGRSLPGSTWYGVWG